MKSRWDFIWILLKTLLHLPRGDARERRAVSEFWIRICESAKLETRHCSKNVSGWRHKLGACVQYFVFVFQLFWTFICLLFIFLYSEGWRHVPGVGYSLHLRVEDEKCDLHCRSCEAHVCVWARYLPVWTACHRHYPPLLRRIFPSWNDLDNVCGVLQIRKISVPWNCSNLETTSNLRMKQTDIKFWKIQASQ